MAKKQRFRYDALLRVREIEEEQQAAHLAKTRRQIHVAEGRRDDIEREQKDMLADAGRTTQQRFAAADVRRYYQFERHLARLAVENDAHLAELAQVEEAQRRELEEAMRRKRVVERLREHGQRAFWAEVRYEEQKITDEAATNKAAVVGAKGADTV